MATTRPKNDDPPGFDELLADVINNPSKILSDDLTEEEIFALQKRISPYTYVGIPSDVKKIAAASFTNLREDYIRRFTMTSLIGFLFKMLDEWEVPAEARRWYPKGYHIKPFTGEELEIHAQALLDLAKVAKEAEAEASVLTKEAEQIVLAGETENITKIFQKADLALAKARGLKHTTTLEMYKLGIDAEHRMCESEAIARRHPEVCEILNKSYQRGYKPPGQLEMPKDCAKNIINNFLRNWFEYNPDAHVRSAHDEFVSDKTRVPSNQQVDVFDSERLPLSVLLKDPPMGSPDDMKYFEEITKSQHNYNSICHILRDDQLIDAIKYILPDKLEMFKKILYPISYVRPAVEIIPPQDTFHRWAYYTEVNYEELRTATEAIYCEKPGLDWAIILYEYFEGSQEEVDKALEKFRDEHINEVISDIKAIEFGGWTFVGDFKANRERINIYNKNTEILKRILERHAQDKKLGADLMRKRVRVAKAKNIKESGPDAPGLMEYRNTHSNLQRQGVERVISPEEMKRLERAKGSLKAAKELEVLDQSQRIINELTIEAKHRKLNKEEELRFKMAQDELLRAREMLEVPEDAIQVDVWTHDTHSGDFTKSKIYTKAEAPIFADKNDIE
jgi:hypothetical protein